ncbi:MULTISPECIES: glycerol kinase GlpK [Hyphobacterium]|uniref:Glycerol kinase GlpK n=1 Tax=Hyphobacterium vulgare TaxID=1736751 RepID=A0ABV7A1K6_9PROT
MKDGILAIDQGTTSSRAILFSPEGAVIASAQQEFAQIYPRPGWVEHDPEVIWATVISTARDALKAGRKAGWRAACAGITNQRETAIVWDRKTGQAIHNAIVWQDRRTAERCREIEAGGAGPEVAAKTGLVLDPYFSATKFAWILDQVDGARERARRGELCFGTVDSFLLWRLTGGKVHATDATNASRTSLYDIRAGRWDEGLLEAFNVPARGLPEVRDCAGAFGKISKKVLGEEIALTGIAGDQQAAAIGQACFAPGEAKSTYGTGAFLLLNTGTEMVASQNRLLSTIAYRIGGETAYAMEGSVLSAGATVQWLRDGLGLFSKASEIESLARSADPDSEVVLVPAFTGLGAPWWDAEARGAILGLTRGAGRAEIAQAALDSTAFQTGDLLAAMAGDGMKTVSLKVDGGMAANDRFLQRLADLTGVEVVRPVNTETTAWGAAFLAALGAGMFHGIEDGRALWQADRAFEPEMESAERERRNAIWTDAVGRVRTR